VLSQYNEHLIDCTYALAQDDLLKYYRVPGGSGCITTIMKTNDDYSAGDRVVRSCYWDDLSEKGNACPEEPFSPYKSKSCVLCETQGCNYVNYYEEDSVSSSTVMGSITTKIVLFFALTRWVS